MFSKKKELWGINVVKQRKQTRRIQQGGKKTGNMKIKKRQDPVHLDDPIKSISKSERITLRTAKIVQPSNWIHGKTVES